MGDPIRLVVISDTHSSHRQLELPAGDILLHCGDFTFYGKRETVTKKGRPLPDQSLPPAQWPRGPDVVQGGADDFNEWLGEQQQFFEHIVVVLGNHEKNQDWTEQADSVLSHATFLKDQSCLLHVRGQPVRLWGTDFWWPQSVDDAVRICTKMAAEGSQSDVVITHGPAEGRVDGGSGCSVLTQCVEEGALPKCSVLACGHVHYAHGTYVDTEMGITFVNAAQAGQKTDLVGSPVVLELTRESNEEKFSVRVA